MQGRFYYSQFILLPLLLLGALFAFVMGGTGSWVWAQQLAYQHPTYHAGASSHSLAQLLRITRDQPILEALYYLQASSASYTVDVLLEQKGRVFFKDMRQMGKAVKDFDALSWRSGNGEWVVFIHQKHRNAPPQALAALISHEAMHSDIENSLAEEAAGWLQEAILWQEMQQHFPISSLLLNDPNQSLVVRLEKLRQAHQDNQIEQLVRSNKGYVGLSETSPGFGG